MILENGRSRREIPSIRQRGSLRPRRQRDRGFDQRQRPGSISRRRRRGGGDLKDHGRTRAVETSMERRGHRDADHRGQGCSHARGVDRSADLQELASVLDSGTESTTLSAGRKNTRSSWSVQSKPLHAKISAHTALPLPGKTGQKKRSGWMKSPPLPNRSAP